MPIQVYKWNTVKSSGGFFLQVLFSHLSSSSSSSSSPSYVVFVPQPSFLVYVSLFILSPVLVFTLLWSLLSLMSVLHVVSVPLTVSFSFQEEMEDLDLSSAPHLVNPGGLLPSCSDRDPLSVCPWICLSFCRGGGWWDVEWRFLWPVCNHFGTIHWSVWCFSNMRHQSRYTRCVFGVHVFHHDPSKYYVTWFFFQASAKSDSQETNVSHLPRWHW